MQISFGNGGWLQVNGADDVPVPVFLRLSPDNRGRWLVREMYAHGDHITPALLRSAPIAEVELIINADPQRLAARADHPGPDLQRLAGWFAGYFSAESDHWVAHSMWAQDKASGIPQAPAARRVTVRSATPRPPLRAPDRLTPEFFRELSAAYVDVVSRHLRPGPTLATEAGVSARTVHRWVLEARKRGFLPRGTQGRAGV